jgi:DNA-binding LytR/AlgR family response regulator
MQAARASLRIFCVEDNPLLVMQLELVIEDAGHIYAGSAARFHDVKTAFDRSAFDIALVDIDLADGRTGGEVAAWLSERGRPSLFITGQEQLARTYEKSSLGTIIKPVSEQQLRDMLNSICARLPTAR